MKVKDTSKHVKTSVCLCMYDFVFSLLMRIEGLQSDWGQEGNEKMFSLVCICGYECL